VDGLGGEDGELDGLAVEDGEGSGEAEAGGADVCIRLAAVLVDAAAEGLGGGEELDMDLEADDGLVLGEDVGRECGGCCGHDPILSIGSWTLAVRAPKGEWRCGSRCE